ncbi:MAG: 16S rRNA (cytidine(1402)-2'-O)-methyltransferase [Anaerolineales bacterium]|jgi:16S rRNA (cytidine1402-2'-O)-methyltransferase
MGTLYLVATPIGNLEDISARALRVLSQAMMIAAEDTRHTRKLLGHYQIHTPLTSYHEHNKLTKLEAVLNALERGDVALVSDAGTPALNDPGYELVRAALQAGYPVSPIPGPSAPISALVASGLPTDAFLYLGYLPRKSSDRRQKLQEVADLPYTLVALETPHRLLSALQDLLDVLGDRQVAIARELTKLHEEILRLTLSQAQAHFQTQAPRGEFTLVIAGKPSIEKTWDEGRLQHELEQAIHQGEPPSQAAARLASLSGWPRRKIYRMATEIAGQ